MPGAKRVKTETTIKLKPRREDILIGKGLDGIFDLVFYRKPSLGIIATKFVEDVIRRQKEANAISISEWHDWIRENRVTQGQFYSVINKLTGIGMIRRERGQYSVSNDFSRTLNMMADIWDARRMYLQSDDTHIRAEP